MEGYDLGVGRPHTERVYVKVTAEFDSTGYMRPVSITWSDGRTFPIEKVQGFRPAGMTRNDLAMDYFTVLIHGNEKLLFLNISTLGSLAVLVAGL